ncbi:T6SS phospholipase effector Tle1-like catalytic domain-containing protein [Pseudomonas knackmussii]|uniref:T6SS phospholipase effector Tle1-like catalytic domain-containing protein n=1 Tax=Pseudomonas knackmussii TaxID=65741 RepID=UPI0013646632|nr:DUF2235 domain-containing protein [Pseudomonas knackmussii]
MSEMKFADLLWYPPQFPEQGRLPSKPLQVWENRKRQESWEVGYHDALCIAAQRRVNRPCCKTAHISLFFDGTGNNLNHDLFVTDPAHPTNIARLFRATIGAGYAGGTASAGSQAQGLTDSLDEGSNQFFKYYMPGVGTPFPEIGDLDFSGLGLATALYGEERINWGLLMIVDALRRMTNLPSLDVPTLKESVAAMTTPMAALDMGGTSLRRRVFERLLNAPDLAPRLRIALAQPTPGTSKLLGIKLYVYGFSRGAAAARAFVNWLAQFLHRPDPEQPAEHCLLLGTQKLPLSVEYLGLLDTVASVGVAHIAPVAEGHMSWADGTMELPDEAGYGGWIKRCLHLVASHEQRLCFPLDSIRRTNGHYPSCGVEVLYPGVHSDLGGGYPPGEQGKGASSDKHVGDGLLLSQIPLSDMFADAFAHGAPLKLPKDFLPESLRQDRWREMEPAVVREFDVAPALIDRFNAWRQVTLGLHADPQPLRDSLANHYEPVRAATSLERALQEQMGWITAWRIDRYAFLSLEGCPFYQVASDSHSDEQVRKLAETLRNDEQREVEKRRLAQLEQEDDPRRPSKPLEPGPKDFDPDMAKTQLRQAAQEFGEDYRGTRRTPTGTFEWALDSIPTTAIYLLNSDDEQVEYERMKKAGQRLVKELFPPRPGYSCHDNETERGQVDESRNAHLQSGLLRALFDDQVHDSRAWFLHYALKGSREPWNSYFRERMVYFGEACNKPLSLLSVAGGVVGAATVSASVVYVIRRGSPAERLALAGAATQYGAKDLTALVSVLDKATGLALPMRDDAAHLRAPTQAIGTLVREQRPAIRQQRIAQAQREIAELWAAHEAKTREVPDAPA